MRDLYDFKDAAARYTRFHPHPVETVGFDFEATGLNLRHGDDPFMLSATFADGRQLLWQAEIDYLTRQVAWAEDDAQEIEEFFSHEDWTYVGSNVKYDARCARKVVPHLDIEALLCRAHETIGQHHLLANQESHGLKDAASKHGAIPNDDETDLKLAVEEARTQADQLGWMIASKSACPQVPKSPDGGYGVMDYGLPRQLALYYWRTSEAGLYLESLPKKPRYKAGLTEDEKVEALFCPHLNTYCNYVTPTWSELTQLQQRTLVKLNGWKWHPPELRHDPKLVLGRGECHPWHSVCAKYCLLDSLRSVTLSKVFQKQLEKEGLWEVYLENRINTVMSFIIEENGVPFHVPTARRLRAAFTSDAVYTKQVAGFALSPFMPFNPNSNQQISTVLYGQPPSGFGLPVTRLSKPTGPNKDRVGSPTTDQDFLTQIIGDLSCCSETFSPQKISDIFPPTYLEGDPTFRKRMQSWHKLLVSDPEEGRAKQLYMFCASLLQHNKNIKGIEQIDNFLLRMLPAPDYYTPDISESLSPSGTETLVSKSSQDVEWATLYSSINPYGTHTGRQSHKDPNAGNISKGGKNKSSVAHLFKDKKTLRVLFGPPPSWEWWRKDYVQFQLIIFAIMSKTDTLVNAYLRGDDLHSITARAMYGHSLDPNSPEWSLFDPENNPDHRLQRDIAKNVNFAFLFGAGRNKIDLTAGVIGMYDVLANRLPTAISFLEQKAWEAQHIGHVFTCGGYKLSLPADKEYSGSVYAIQGTEAEIVKRATYGIQDYIDRRNLRSRLKIVLPVHDELDTLSRSGEGQRHIGSLCTIMESAAASFGIPARVEASLCVHNWSEGVLWEEEKVMSA